MHHSNLAPLYSSKFAYSIHQSAVATVFSALIDKTMAAVIDIAPAADDILGGFVNVASLVRSVSFHEGKLLEQAVIQIAKANPNLVILHQSIRLPIVPAAEEALAGNNWQELDGIVFDSDARCKKSYTPDLIIINKRTEAATIVDMKRSLASYGDTNRLGDLKAKMLASALALPDWLYKQHKRLSVKRVDVAIIDGASRAGERSNGIWKLSELDALLEIENAASVIAALRAEFGKRARSALARETERAHALSTRPAEKRGPGRPPKNREVGEQNTYAESRATQATADVVQMPRRVSIGFAVPPSVSAG